MFHTFPHHQADRLCVPPYRLIATFPAGVLSWKKAKSIQRNITVEYGVEFKRSLSTNHNQMEPTKSNKYKKCATIWDMIWYYMILTVNKVGWGHKPCKTPTGDWAALLPIIQLWAGVFAPSPSHNTFPSVKLRPAAWKHAHSHRLAQWAKASHEPPREVALNRKKWNHRCQQKISGPTGNLLYPVLHYILTNKCGLGMFWPKPIWSQLGECLEMIGWFCNEMVMDQNRIRQQIWPNQTQSTPE